MPNWAVKLPNRLTIARIAAIPVLLLIYPLDFKATNIICAIVFAVAAATDFFDGYFARKYKLVTDLGTILDPIADKLLLAAALIVLSYARIAPPILIGLLICRDFGINGLRLVAQTQGISLPVSSVGKSKTMLMSASIFCLMINRPIFGVPFPEIGMIGLWASLVVSLYSAWQYSSVFFGSRKK